MDENDTKFSAPCSLHVHHAFIVQLKILLTLHQVQMFEHAATSLNLPMRVLASNLWLFGPVLGLNFMAKDAMRALITSTIAFTKIHGGELSPKVPSLNMMLDRWSQGVHGAE